MKRSALKRKKPMARQRVPMKRSGRLRAKRDPEMEAWSRDIIARDGGCMYPGGCDTKDRRLDAHHIAERSLRPDLKYVRANGIALCRTHHHQVPLRRAESIALGLLSDETYERAMKYL
jgi:5-methylcytosine-specific restriction endonuclease McrA